MNYISSVLSKEDHSVLDCSQSLNGDVREFDSELLRRWTAMSHALSILSKDNHVDCLKSFDWKLLKSAGSHIIHLEHLFDCL